MKLPVKLIPGKIIHIPMSTSEWERLQKKEPAEKDKGSNPPKSSGSPLKEISKPASSVMETKIDASLNIQILYENDHYRKAEFREELQKAVQAADLVVFEFPQEFTDLIQELSNGGIEVDNFMQRLKEGYARFGGREMVFENENRILYEIIHRSGKIIIGSERLQASIVNMRTFEIRINDALGRGEFESALNSFVELLSHTAQWTHNRNSYTRQALKQVRMRFPDKRILYIGGSIHTFIGNMLDKEGVPVERMFVGRRQGEPLAVFRYDDALVRLIMHDLERNRTTRIPLSLAAKAMLTNVWINMLKSQGRRASANFLQMNRAVSGLSFQDIKGLILDLVNGRRSWYSIEEQLLLSEEKFSASPLAETPQPASSSLIEKAPNAKGGIDLSSIEFTLKDDAYVSNLIPVDLKVLRAAKALKDGWESLSLLYVHEIMLLFKDNFAKDITNKGLLSQVLEQLKTKDFLDPQAIQFFNLIQSQKPLSEITIAEVN